MRKNPLNKGIIMENAGGIGTMTPAMVEARARELALINGHGSSGPTEADYQQAKRELTGEEEIDPQEENVESLPNRRIGIPCRVRPDGKQRNLLVKMKMPKDEARPRRCSKKALMKQSTIKCVGQPKRRSRVTSWNRDSRVCKALEKEAGVEVKADPAR